MPPSLPPAEFLWPWTNQSEDCGHVTWYPPITAHLGRGHEGGRWQAVVGVRAAVSLLRQFLAANVAKLGNIFKLLSATRYFYPVDGLEELDVHGVAGELALYLDQGVAGGHSLHQETVSGQS